MAASKTAKFHADNAVTVEGLDQFRKELKALAGQWPRMLSKVNKAYGEVVASDARKRAVALGGVHAKVAQTIKAAAAQRYAAVNLGGDSWPMALGAEFGAKQYPQFPPWRGNGWRPDEVNGVGYMLHPAIRETEDEAAELYLDAIVELASKAFPDSGGIP